MHDRFQIWRKNQVLIFYFLLLEQLNVYINFTRNALIIGLESKEFVQYADI